MSDIKLATVPDEMIVLDESISRLAPRVSVLMRVGRKYLKVPCADVQAWMSPDTNDWNIQLRVSQVDALHAETWQP